MLLNSSLNSIRTSLIKSTPYSGSVTSDILTESSEKHYQRFIRMQFQDVRSLLHQTTWDNEMYDQLHLLCHDIKEQNPFFFMTQIVPYLASFESQWFKHPYISNSPPELRVMWMCLPCIQFKFNLNTLKNLESSSRMQRHLPTFNIRELDLNLTNTFQTFWIEDLTSIAPNLQKLSIKANSLESTIAQSVELESLTHLDLSLSEISELDFQALTQCGVMNHLTHLKMTENPQLEVPDHITHILT